jgi:PAS domain S-box-containing protein
MPKKEIALNELIFFLDSIIDNIPHMVFLKEAKTLTFVKLNKATEHLLGFKVADMLGKNDYDFFPKEQADFFIKKDRDVLNSQSLIDIPGEEVDSKSLGKIYLHTKKIPLFNQNHEPVYLLGISENITEKIERENKILQLNKILEQKLAASETLNRLLLQSTAEGICGVDEQGNIIFINQAAEQILAYEENELLGTPITQIIYPKSAGSNCGESSKIYAAFKEGKTYREVDEVMWRQDQTPVPVEYVSSPMYKNNNLIGAVIVFNDITERKRTEKVLRDASQQLCQSNQSLDAFAYTASHDLKAPLRAIERLSTWIEEDAGDKLDKPCKENLTLLRKRVIRMSNLIDGILQHSRIGRISPEICEVKLTTLLKEIVDNVNPSRKFIIEYPQDLPVLSTDRTQLEQIFSNLINNSIMHHHKAVGRIEIGCKDLGNFYEFWVKDDGPGIEPQYFEKIFQIFQTLHSKDKFESTGIGLSIVKKIVEVHDGTVTVESAKGKGALFRFTWPKILS